MRVSWPQLQLTTAVHDTPENNCARAHGSCASVWKQNSRPSLGHTFVVKHWISLRTWDRRCRALIALEVNAAGWKNHAHWILAAC